MIQGSLNPQAVQLQRHIVLIPLMIQGSLNRFCLRNTRMVNVLIPLMIQGSLNRPTECRCEETRVLIPLMIQGSLNSFKVSTGDTCGLNPFDDSGQFEF